jgi:mannosyltransferase OCH1-like enzyme
MNKTMNKTINTLLIIFIIIIFIIIINHLITSSCKNYISYNNENFYINNNNKIPLNIYQTFHTKDLPTKMKECVETLKKQNPEFVHHLFDDDDCRKFIKDNFKEEVLKAYDSIIPGAFKSDLWRYCILYKNGGIYMDIKYKCADNVKLIDFIDKEYFVVDYYHNNERGVYNAIMICYKNNPILLKAIYRIIDNVNKKYYGNTALTPTGPTLLGKIFTDDEFNKIPLIFKIKLKNEHNEIFSVSNKSDNKLLFITYPEYRKEQKKYNDKYPYYSDLWNKRKIYK